MSLSFPSCLLLERRWRNRDMAAAVAYLQLHRPAPRPATPGCRAGVGMGHRPRRHLRAPRALLRPDAPRGGRAAPAHGGRTFAEAADELVVSLNTVKSHVRRIYAKMAPTAKPICWKKVSRPSSPNWGARDGCAWCTIR
ncbi:MAG: hypothetical protein ACLSVD_06260 [Eggerthellaceae bacterium]